MTAAGAATPPGAREQGAASLSDLPRGSTKQIVVAGRPILLCRVDERVYAVEARCPHRRAPLAEGVLAGPMLACPWHKATFDVRTGSRISSPECRDLETWPVRVRGDQVFVIVPTPEER